MRERFHHGRKDGDFHVEGGDCRSLGFIGGIDDEGGGEGGVEFCYADGGRCMAELGEHFVGGAFEGLAGDDGADGEDFLLMRLQLLADAGDG